MPIPDQTPSSCNARATSWGLFLSPAHIQPKKNPSLCLFVPIVKEDKGMVPGFRGTVVLELLSQPRDGSARALFFCNTPT